MKKTHLFLILILILGGFLRFYNLSWGNGYFFHPDERNIAMVVDSIRPPVDFKFFLKGTFSYGSLIPYVVYFIDLIRRSIFSTTGNFDQFKFFVITLRFFSALFSSLTIYLIYFTGRKFWNQRVGILLAVLMTFSAGAIQAAHFGTFEGILTFLYLLVLFFSLSFWQSHKFIYFFLSIFFTGIACAIKINSAILLPVLYILLFLRVDKLGIVKNGVKLLFATALLPILVVLLSPYYLTSQFLGMIRYEQGVVTGTLDVFYTREFIGSVPVLFQATKIIPFVINPLFVIVFPIVSIFYLIVLVKKFVLKEFIVLIFLGILFIPNAFLYSKWTRYIIPSIPFFFLFMVIAVDKLKHKVFKLVLYLLIIVNALWGLSFMYIYLRPDVRLSASEWIYDNMNNGSFLLSETANVIDIPIPVSSKTNQKNFTVINFDFYNLDENNSLQEQLVYYLEKADYILIPSRRIFGGMGQVPTGYPLVNRYYQALFDGRLGFGKVAEFSSFPNLEFGIWNLEFDDERGEETFTVFDHPVIRIYKKIKQYNKNDYQGLLTKKLHN